MRLTTLTSKVFSLFVLLAATASLSRAISLPVRGASNYGTGTSFAGCVANPSFCGEGFNLTPVGTFALNGKTYSVVQFAFDSTLLTTPLPGGGNILNVVDLGMIGPNTTFTLPPAFFTPALTEIFSCNQFAPGPVLSNPEQTVVNSGGMVIPGPCVPGLTSAPDISLNPDGSFTTGANFNLTDLVLDSPVPTNTPEPATLLLFGAGLLAVGRKLRRTS